LTFGWQARTRKQQPRTIIGVRCWFGISPPIGDGKKIHPNLAYGYEVRGQIYNRMGELEEAVADLDFAVQASGAGPDTQRLRIELRRKLNRM
jgi:hypothetical protein